MIDNASLLEPSNYCYEMKSTISFIIRHEGTTWLPMESKEVAFTVSQETCREPSPAQKLWQGCSKMTRI